MTVSGAPRPRWCLGTRLLVIGTVGWFCALVAHLFLSGNWWMWTFAELLPPLALVVIPLLLAAFIHMAAVSVRLRLAILCAGSMALGAPMAGIHPAVMFGGEVSDTADLRVFSWNTQYWTQDVDPGDFYDYLHEQDADVYLLQEYLNLRDDEVVPIDDSDRLHHEFPGYDIVITSELVTISRFPILADHALDTSQLLSDAAGSNPPVDDPWRDYWTTKVLRTDISVAGQVVSLYNSHVSVPIPTTGAGPFSAEFYTHSQSQFHRREAQLEMLYTDLSSHDNRVLVSGDFNATSLSGTMIELGERLDCHVPAGGSPLPASWPSDMSLWQLDWSCTAGGAGIADYRFESGAGLSDHDAQAIGLTVR